MPLAWSPLRAEAEERRPGVDTRALFSPGGALSPGFPQAHVRSTAAPLDLLDEDERVPRIAVLANPALGAFGKWSARLEVAPLRAHALFVEVSTVRFDGGDVRVTGTELDLGYHLYPLDRGLSGFYLGPRYVRASGESDSARGTVRAYGGDIGFQWVVGVIAINVGVGAAWAKITIDPKLELATSPEVAASLPEHVETSQILPLGTLAFGLAF